MYRLGDNFGCEHYRRSVKLIATCCSKAYYCRFCHDDIETHKINRTEVVALQCARCNTKQKVAERCVQCKIRFGMYTCLSCKLFDHEDKAQFHCSKCGICRVGGRENYFHCSKCNLCLNYNIQDSHKCVENASRTDCPICLLNLHESVKPLKVLKCGHILHEECFGLLEDKNIHSCPLCQAPISFDTRKQLDYAGVP